MDHGKRASGFLSLQEATIVNIIYSSNGFAIFEVLDHKDNKFYKFMGYAIVNCGECINISGDETVSSVYGASYKISAMDKVLPTKKAQLIEYLSSDIFSGIDRTLAMRLHDEFGDNILVELQSKPDFIADKLGISTKIVAQWKLALDANHLTDDLVRGLEAAGYSKADAIKIVSYHNKFPEESIIDLAKTNPYCISGFIKGFDFERADKVFLKQNKGQNDKLRLEYVTGHILRGANYNGGNTILSTDQIIRLIQKTKYNISKERLAAFLTELPTTENFSSDSLLVQLKREGIQYIALREYMQYEAYIAEKLVQLSYNRLCTDEKAKSITEQIAKKSPHPLTAKQKDAVIGSLTKGVLVLTGGPGTGKTFTVQSIINAFEMLHMDGDEYSFVYSLVASTGKAARRLEESTGKQAETIHRKLQATRDGEFGINELNPLMERVVIVDESSMADAAILYSLLKGVKDDAILILVGDVDQLQSVGAGNCLSDIIDSGQFKTICLDIVQRQDSKSTIPVNCSRINDAKIPEFNKTDFFNIKKATEEKLFQALELILTQNIYALLPDVNVFTDIQILAPQRLLVKRINEMAQNCLNPVEPGKRAVTVNNILFREGDKVIQTDNDKNVQCYHIDSGTNTIISVENGINNGDIGIIESIQEDGEMIIMFDGYRRAKLKKEARQHLDLAYAITIHKSMGSQYKAIITVLTEFMPKLMTKNALYTAASRAEEAVIFIGNYNTLEKMCRNTSLVKRNTMLKFFLDMPNAPAQAI